MEAGIVLSGKYRLERLLAEGGMGRVWAATHELTSRRVAVKVLRQELASQPEALSRFAREARAAGQLRHPNVIEVLDVGVMDDGRPYLVLELLAGEALDALLVRRRALPPVEAVRILAPIARALQAAHAAGIVHRDVTPANVFLARAPGDARIVPKLLDFGISKVVGPAHDGSPRTGDGAVLGCPQYMSPEQAAGAERVDPRTDVWSLGVVLYECIAGVVPFRAPNYNSLMCGILSAPHRPLAEAAPGVDPGVAAVVERCLRKPRSQRWATAGELAEALENASAPERVTADAPVARDPPRRSARTAFHGSARRRALWASGAGGAGLGVALGVAALTGHDGRPLRSAPPHDDALALAIAEVDRRLGPVVTPVVTPVAEPPSKPSSAGVAREGSGRRATAARRSPSRASALAASARPVSPGDDLPAALVVAAGGLPRDDPYGR